MPSKFAAGVLVCALGLSSLLISACAPLGFQQGTAQSGAGDSSNLELRDIQTCETARELNDQLLAEMAIYPTETAEFEALPEVQQLKAGIAMDIVLQKYSSEFEKLVPVAWSLALKSGLTNMALWTHSLGIHYLSLLSIPVSDVDQFGWMDRCDAILPSKPAAPTRSSSMSAPPSSPSPAPAPETVTATATATATTTVTATATATVTESSPSDQCPPPSPVEVSVEWTDMNYFRVSLVNPSPNCAANVRISAVLSCASLDAEGISTNPIGFRVSSPYPISPGETTTYRADQIFTNSAQECQDPGGVIWLEDVSAEAESFYPW